MASCRGRKSRRRRTAAAEFGAYATHFGGRLAYEGLYEYIREMLVIVMVCEMDESTLAVVV